MSVLDLQGMKAPEPTKGPPPGSRGSKGCGVNQSNLSVLCDVL